MHKLFTPNVQLIFSAIKNVGAETRMVGGCVRDVIANIDIKDIDFAVNVPPAVAKKACADAGLIVIDNNGLRFGTIVIIIDGVNYEMTSLRTDLECNGRHAEVAYTDNWREDAKRRDFTFNALYLDEHGQLYDFFDGADDLQAGVLQFIGDPEERIREDYLRMLRMLRFYARFARKPIDQHTISICKKYAGYIDALSGERIWQEIQALFAVKQRLPEALYLMLDTGMIEHIFCGINLKRFDDAVACVHKLATGDHLLKLACFIAISGAHECTARWKTPNKMLKFVKDMSEIIPLTERDFLTMDKKYLNVYGRELYNCGLLAAMAIKGIDAQLITDALVPELPITSKDIIDAGLSGAAIGNMKKRVNTMWLDSNCELSRAELLEYIAKSRQ